MTLPWIIATVHLLSIGLGLAAVRLRASALRRPLDNAGLARVFRADNAWGIAAALFIGTGLWRAFGGIEKGSSYYMESPWFHAKLGLVIAVALLELWPMVSLIRWRFAQRRGAPLRIARARVFAVISDAQFLLSLMAVFCATAMARAVQL